MNKGHEILWSIPFWAGPRRTRPGEMFMRLSEKDRKAVVDAVNSKTQPAPWVIAMLCGE